MSLKQVLAERSGGGCELCRSIDGPTIYAVPPDISEDSEKNLLVCTNCLEQLNAKTPFSEEHWRCLGECIWSEVEAVKVVSWRLLNFFSNAAWAQELMEQLYLEEESLAWAKKAVLESAASTGSTVTKDNFGNILNNGDSVTLVKDLDVKGANFTAKRGTLVKNITLTNDPGLIEGRVGGVQIVLITKFLKKA